MTAPDIRPTTEADLPAITAIYQQAVREGTATFELEPPDLAEMTRRYRALVDGGYPYFVAILDGRVAGYAYRHTLYAKHGLGIGIDNGRNHHKPKDALPGRNRPGSGWG